MLEQFGGPQGELAAACRYFTQYLAEDDPGRRDMLIDIATEELSHLEVIGTIVAMLNKGSKGASPKASTAKARCTAASPAAATTRTSRRCCTAAARR
jgi:Mn-containing catalase